MKNDVEQGIRDFIEAAIRFDQSLAAEDPLPIALLTDGGEDTVDETASAIIVVVEDQPAVAGNLIEARASVVVSSPRAKGAKTDHDTWCRFVRDIFEEALPPELPPNAAHISEYLGLATGNITGRSYHVESSDSSDNETRWQYNRNMVFGLITDDPEPLVSSGDITV